MSVAVFHAVNHKNSSYPVVSSSESVRTDYKKAEKIKIIETAGFLFSLRFRVPRHVR